MRVSNRIERIVHGVKERKRPVVGNEERWSRI
jgi:hypothetical protein